MNTPKKLILILALLFAANAQASKGPKRYISLISAAAAYNLINPDAVILWYLKARLRYTFDRDFNQFKDEQDSFIGQCFVGVLGSLKDLGEAGAVTIFKADYNTRKPLISLERLIRSGAAIIGFFGSRIIIKILE